MAALLHDGSEGYAPDLQTPLKALLPEFKAIEERVQAAIFKRFGLPYPMDVSIKEADLKALATERRDLTPWGEDYWPLLGDVKPLPFKIAAMSPQEAYSAFMDRFFELADALIFDNPEGFGYA